MNIEGIFNIPKNVSSVYTRDVVQSHIGKTKSPFSKSESKFKSTEFAWNNQAYSPRVSLSVQLPPMKRQRLSYLISLHHILFQREIFI